MPRIQDTTRVRSLLYYQRKLPNQLKMWRVSLLRHQTSLPNQLKTVRKSLLCLQRKPPKQLRKLKANLRRHRQKRLPSQLRTIRTSLLRHHQIRMPRQVKTRGASPQHPTLISTLLLPKNVEANDRHSHIWNYTSYLLCFSPNSHSILKYFQSIVNCYSLLIVDCKLQVSDVYIESWIYLALWRFLYIIKSSLRVEPKCFSKDQPSASTK